MPVTFPPVGRVAGNALRQGRENTHCCSALLHLSPGSGFAIRRRDPDPLIDGICHPQPHQNPQRV